MALGDDIKKAKEESIEFNQIIKEIDSTLKGLAAVFQTGILSPQKTQIEQAKILDKLQKNYNKDLDKTNTAAKSLVKKVEEQRKKTDKGQASEASAQSLLEAIQARRAQLEVDANNAREEGLDIGERQVETLKKQLEETEKLAQADLERIQNQDKSLAAVGKISKATTGLLSKLGLGGLNEFFNLDKASAESKVMLEQGKDKTNVFGKVGVISGNIFKNLDKAALGAGLLFGLAGKLVKLFLKGDQATTDISRQLGMSAKEAKAFKSEMIEAAGAGDLLSVTTKEQLKTIDALNNSLGGVAFRYDKEFRVAAAESLALLKLSEESVAGLGQLALMNNKTFAQQKKEQSEIIAQVQNETGVRLTMRGVMEEVGKITGIARVNMDKFPGGLTKAVALSKTLGVNMEAVAGAAGTLLDFEDSIAKELEAELLLGRDLNLERARAAALAGDQTALMQELVNEAGSLEELQNMNVLQQQALADSLGLSVDELANMIMNGEIIDSQREQELEIEAAKQLQAEQSLSLQEKQARAMENMADTVSSLGKVLLVAAAAAAAMAIGLSFGVASLAIAGGIALAGAAIYGITQLVNDGIADSSRGPFAITDKFGATAITARGDNLAVSPNITRESGGGGSDSGMKETNMLLKQILNKEGTVKMDATNVGTAFSVNSRQIQ